MQVLVSAIVTTYRRDSEIVRRAINSIINQTYSCCEIIVVDDNREDEEGVLFSKKIKQLQSELDFILIKTANGKHGAQQARNTGIEKAQGEWVAMLDDDDEWYPYKIERQVEILERYPDAGMVYCRGMLVIGNKIKRELHGKGFVEQATYSRLLEGDCIGCTSQALIKKSVIDDVGGFDEDFPARQDYEMWIRISKKYLLVGVNEILFNHIIDNDGEYISKKWDKCIEGHQKLYNKYKSDIDKSRKAKFNVIFYMAHYYRQKRAWIMSAKLYLKAFFISPLAFSNKGREKINQIFG